MMRKIFVYTSLVACMLFLSACGEVVDGIRAVKQISDSVDIDTKNQQITIKQEGENGGTLQIGSQDIPEGFPDKIPLPKDARIITSYKSSTSDSDSFSLAISTSTSMEAAKKQYKALFDELQFKDFSELAMNEMITYTGGSEREFLMVTMMQQDDNSLAINFTYDIKPLNGHE